MSDGQTAPRLLLRRLFAFLIDQLIVWTLLFGFVQLSGRDDLNTMFKDAAHSTF